MTIRYKFLKTVSNLICDQIRAEINGELASAVLNKRKLVYQALKSDKTGKLYVDYIFDRKTCEISFSLQPEKLFVEDENEVEEE